MNRDAAFAAANVRFLKNRIGSIGADVRSSQSTNATNGEDAERERGDDLGARPALAVAADEAPDDPEEPGAPECQAGQVERGVRPAAVGQPSAGERDAERGRSGR